VGYELTGGPLTSGRSGWVAGGRIVGVLPIAGLVSI
jgi:hypothetical protein